MWSGHYRPLTSGQWTVSIDMSQWYSGDENTRKTLPLRLIVGSGDLSGSNNTSNEVVCDGPAISYTLSKDTDSIWFRIVLGDD